MFEGTIVPAVVDRAAEGSALRAPRWRDLVARLAAADDLRRTMACADGHPAGNFERFGERGEGTHRPRQRLVNHDGLAHGKGPGGKILPPQMAR